MRKSKRQHREELLSCIMASLESERESEPSSSSDWIQKIDWGGGVVACEGRNLHAIWCFNMSFAIVI